MIADGIAQVYVPIMFTIGAPGQSPQQTRFLMDQVLVKTHSGWRVSSILPIPAPRNRIDWPHDFAWAATGITDLRRGARVSLWRPKAD